ncbi:hypothetical protein C0991_005657 [Blastosporella zonata]|nr:hypothetical protein C0991_005657 [Blastosporella zonata]
MKNSTLEIPYYVPLFLWQFWLSPTGPNDLPRDSRLHIYNVYDNDLGEIRIPPQATRPVFQDLATKTSSKILLRAAELAFYTLESEAEKTLSDLINRTYSSGVLDKSTSFGFDKLRLTNLCRYLVFLRFRNSAKYRNILECFETGVIETRTRRISSTSFVESQRRYFLRDIVAFLENASLEDGTWSVMDPYCWSLSGADLSIGLATNGQEFIFSDSCYGTLNEGFGEDPECRDLFFPILPSFALYVIGSADKNTQSRTFTIANSRIEVGIESASDVHLRNSMILQTYPQYLYFSALRPMALSVASYDEFRWVQEHQDYSRLKQRCRQKYLQESVTKTLVIKGSLILTDLTDNITRIGTCPAGYGSFADVWMAVWNDPIDKRSRHVALKVLRTVMVKEKLMKVNILIDENGCPIITDFGLSKVVEDLSDSITIASSFFAGSARWMAPELIRALIEDEAGSQVATGGLPFPHRSNDHAVTVDILRGIKPSRGTHCLIKFKDEGAFWNILDDCWNEAPYLRPTMKNLVGTLNDF